MVQNCESVTNIYSQLFPRLERTNQVLYVCMYVYAKIGLKNMYTSKPTANAFYPLLPLVYIYRVLLRLLEGFFSGPVSSKSPSETMI